MQAALRVLRRMFSTGLFIIVAIYVVLRLWAMRWVLLLGEPISTAAFTLNLVLGFGLLIGTLLRLSPVHLWWWLPLSLVISIVLVLSRFGEIFILRCLALLAWPVPLKKS